ncbi:MAG: acyl-CoA dehydrogenase family protein [Pseudomonadota bacterium]
MDLSVGPELDDFRAEVRQFLRDNLPDDIRRKCEQERMYLSAQDQRRWHNILATRGWQCPHWPAEVGGTGWSEFQRYIFEEELAYADAPRTHASAHFMLGPTLLEYGTEEQKRQFLKPVVDQGTFWCQGFSEPNAGSDLAALKCAAVREGDEYVINGSKLWTSEAQYAEWMFGIFRTDNSGKRQYGITFLILDMKSPGVTVEPVILFNGEHEVNAVFFDNVRVPVSQRVGDEHQGWGIAKFLLGAERLGIAEVARTRCTLERTTDLARSFPSPENPAIRRPEIAARIAQIDIELRSLARMEQRVLSGHAQRGTEESMLKIKGSELLQLVLELHQQIVGPYAQIDEGEVDPETGPGVGPWACGHAGRAFFDYRKLSIYGGSNETMRNIMAKVLSMEA